MKSMKIFKKLFRQENNNLILVFGLGNPGKKHEKSRHNIGRMVLDFLEKKHGSGYQEQKKFKADISEGIINNQKVLFAKSQGFMNQSGIPLRAIKDYYKIKEGNIWVIQDDVDIAFGKIKSSKERGAAGHHGIESVIKHLGSNKFNRLRIGIWNRSFEEKNKEITQSYVMQNFSEEEEKELVEIKKSAASIIEAAIENESKR